MLWHEVIWNINAVVIPQVQQKIQEMCSLQLIPEGKAVKLWVLLFLVFFFTLSYNKLKWKRQKPTQFPPNSSQQSELRALGSRWHPVSHNHPSAQNSFNIYKGF